MEDLIPTFFELYDKSINNYNDLINYPSKIYLEDNSIVPTSDGIINFEDNKKGEYFSINSFFLGSYNKKEKIWIWNWCYPISKSNNKLGNELINYALNFEAEKLKRDDFKYIRSILVNSRISIDENFNLELLKGLIMYITNIKVLIPINHKDSDYDIDYYYGLENPENKQTDI